VKSVASVLSYNHPQLTIKTINSLLDHFSLSDIYLTHNGSNESNIQSLKLCFPGINHIINNPNIGYAGGVNFSFREILKNPEINWIYFFSNDTTLKQLPNYLPEQPGLYGPISYRRNGISIDSVGGVFIPYLSKVYHTKSKNEFGKSQSTYIPGSAFLLHRKIFEITGGTDEALFCYFEDIDWCMRIKKANGKLDIIESFVTCHGISKTTRKDSYYTFYLYNRNCRRISRRYTSIRQRPILEIILIINFFKLLIYLIKKKRFAELKLLPSIF
jgi:GT2 family glycosyltransferase